MGNRAIAGWVFAAMSTIATTVVAMIWTTIDPVVGYWILAACGLGFVIALALFFWPHELFGAASPMVDKPTFDQRVMNNVVGGDMHVTYNNAGRAEFTQEVGEAILRDVPKDAPVRLRVVGSNADQAVGQQVCDFLVANGYRVEVHKIGMLAPPPDKPFTLRRDEGASVLTVAPSAR